MWFALAGFVLVVAIAVDVVLFMLVDRRLNALDALLERLAGKVDKTHNAQLAARLDLLEQALTKWRDSVQSNFGKIWAKLAAPREPAQPKKLDRDELRRQHLPKVQQ